MYSGLVTEKGNATYADSLVSTRSLCKRYVIRMAFSESGIRISVSMDRVFGADDFIVATIPIEVFFAESSVPDCAG